MTQTYPDRSKAHYWAWGMLALILIGIRAYLILLNPAAPPDSTWSISAAFSVLRGDFLINQYVGSNAVFYYHYLLVPFFAILKGKYSIFVFYELVKIGLSWLIFKLLLKRFKWSMAWSFAVAALVYLDKELLMMRPELVLGTLILMFHLKYLKRTAEKKPIYPSMFFFFALFVLHPIAALMHALMFVLLHDMYRLKSWNSLKAKELQAVFMVAVLAVVYTLFSPAGKAQLAMGGSRLEGRGLYSLFYFLKMSFPLFVALVVMRLSQRNLKIYLIQSIPFFVLITFIGGHYYYVYFLIFTVLDMVKQCELPRVGMTSFKAYFIFILVMISGFLSIVHPYFVYQESDDFVDATHDVFKVMETLSKTQDTLTVYVDPTFAMPMLSHAKTRMLYKGEPAFGNVDYNLKPGDKVFITSKLDSIRFSRTHHAAKVKFTTLVPFSEGILSLSSLYQKRVNHYGFQIGEVKH